MPPASRGQRRAAVGIREQSGQPPQRRRRLERKRVAQPRIRVLPRALGVERRLAHVVETREPAAQRLGHGQIADPQHQVGTLLGRERRAAQQRVVVGYRRDPPTRARQRIGEQRPARRRGELGGGRSERRPALVAASDDHASARGSQQRCELASRRTRWLSRHSRARRACAHRARRRAVRSGHRATDRR